jgi:4-alpha-glucanotransferase
MTKQSPIFHQRRTGILLHPTSLPSGVLDADVERWLQLLADSGFSVWQVLPLGDPQGGLSPYQCTSAFAMNPLLLPDHAPVNEKSTGYIKFCEKQQFWLDDYVVFKVLKQHFNDAGWNEWPDKWKFRDALAMQQTHQQYKQAITELKWQQYQLHKRWQEIKDKATAMGILLFGDMPIFIAYDSADVWAHPELFLLDANDNMTVVTGVPPDYFSETGQRWGNPHYDWGVMQEDGYAWWKARTHHLLDQFDIVRIDHFRGLEAAWMIDASCPTAVQGQWLKMPGDELLSAIQEGHKQLPFVAEDLGTITPEVTALRKKYHLPGMSILQFGFDEFDDNPHKPKNITEDTIVYTGTHDNDTTKGWYNSLEDHVKKYVLQVLNLPASDYMSEHTANSVVDTMIDNAMSSQANICIIPLQDCLHLGSEARMNTPGTTTENWQWRFEWQQIDLLYGSSQIEKMHLLNEKANRLVSSDQ